MADILAISGWLVFDERSLKRVTATREPKLDANERAMFMTIEVPLALFRKPQLSATVRLEPEFPLVGHSMIDVTPDAVR